MTDNLFEATRALIDALDEDTRQKLRHSIAILNHEIRTNVTSIEGFSNLLLEGKRGELSEEEKRMLNYIPKRVRTIKEIINESTQIIMGLKGED